jgi:integrase
MSVQRRVMGGRARWLVRWLEDGRHRGRMFDRKADALAFEAEQRRRAQMGAHAPAEPSRDRLGEWLRRWFERDGPRWARSTRIHRGYVVDKWIVPDLEGVRLRDLGSARVRDWQAAILGRGCSPHQANQSLRVLSAALGAAVRDGLLPANPCAGVARLRVTPKRPRALTALEVERIRVEMPTLRDVVMLGLLAYAGFRTEEVLALRWGSVGAVLVVDEAFTHGELKGTKTHQRRTVEVIPPLAADLDLLRPKLADARALVCPSETGGHLHLGNWRARVWRPACERAGVDATPYDGRHTFASLLIHEGRSPLLVAAALGHASGETTWRHYAHLFEGARHAPAMPMAEAAATARAELRAAGLHPSCTESPVRVLRTAPIRAGKGRLAGGL